MRTLKQIYDSIRAAFGASQVLTELDIDVPTAVEYNIIAASAQAHMSLEAVWEVKLKELQDAADRTQNYSGPWYLDETKKFQYGDTLVWNPATHRYDYALIDESKRIVKYSAIGANANGNGENSVKIKVAKQVGGLPAELTVAEQTAIQAYWDIKKPVGTFLSILSAPGDKIQLNWGIYHDGLRNLDELKADIEKAVNLYFTTLEFGGIIRRSDLIDRLKQIPGIVDVSPDEALAIPDNTGLPIYIGTEWRTYAGYALIDPLNPLSSTLYYDIATR